jgi:aspartate aminotransferase
VIAAELEQLLEPLERFETIRRGVARLGDRLADLSYANPYEGVQESARAALRETLAEERALDLQYSPFGGQTLSRRAVADALTESHGPEFTFRDVVLTPGAMAALHIALRSVGAPGDEVVVPVPCWLDYPLFVRHCGLVPVLVPLEPPDFGLDAGPLADAISDRTCAVLLSHPANPTGRSYPGSELGRLGEALRAAEARVGRSLTLIADETHRDFLRAGAYETASAFFERTLIVYSFGKYHFMQGQRLGYAAVSPRHPDRDALSTEMVRWTRIAGYATPTALMQRALPRLLALRHNDTWLDGRRQQVLDELSRLRFPAVRPDGTLFIYVRTPPPFEDFEFVAKLASGGVLVLPAPVFHHRGYFRLSLTGSAQMLERSLGVLEQVDAS